MVFFFFFSFFNVISRPEAWLQINQVSVLRIARANHNKCQGKRDGPFHPRTRHLEWKLMPPVQEGDNLLKQCVCFSIQRGLPFYFWHARERYHREREGKKPTHTQIALNTKEIQGEQIISWVKCWANVGAKARHFKVWKDVWISAPYLLLSLQSKKLNWI